MRLPLLAPAPLITLSWLVRLRWIAVAGQLFTIAVSTSTLGVRLPVALLVSVVLLTAATNLALTVLLRSDLVPSGHITGATLILDTLLLTVLLALSGGPLNPFGTLYLLHVTLAVVLLGGRWGAAMVAIVGACSASLFWRHVPLPGFDAGASPAWALYLRGIWLALLVTSAVIVYFVARISSELRTRDAELLRIQEQVATNEKLSSLTTLAAGAAHELGTPLATIAVVAKELERSAAKAGQGTLAEDAQLIREQVERCRGILVQMSAKAGESAGEMPAAIDTLELVDELRRVLTPDQSRRLAVHGIKETVTLTAPRAALIQVLASLVRNAFDASEPDAAVTLTFSRQGDSRQGGAAQLVVHDSGHGMPPEILARAGDPFFSTKPPGRGMGLGLFLARAFAEGLGGSFRLESAPGAGTDATLSLPLDPANNSQPPPIPTAKGAA